MLMRSCEHTYNALTRCLAQFTFLLDDVGIPLNYRHMEGFGVHTFVLLNAAGRPTLVKFHWKPTCGACAARMRGQQGELHCLV